MIQELIQLLQARIEVIEHSLREIEHLDFPHLDSRFGEIYETLTKLAEQVQILEEKASAEETESKQSSVEDEPFEGSMYIPINTVMEEFDYIEEETAAEEFPELFDDDFGVDKNLEGIPHGLPIQTPPSRPLEEVCEVPKIHRQFVRPSRPSTAITRKWIPQKEAINTLDIDEDTFEALLDAHEIEHKLINNRKMYLLNEIHDLRERIYQEEDWEEESEDEEENDSAMSFFDRFGLEDDNESEEKEEEGLSLLQGLDDEIQNEIQRELEYDTELQELISATTHDPVFHFVQENGSCFISNTKNANYNAINLAAILMEVLRDSEAKELQEQIMQSLRDKEDLLKEMSQLVGEELTINYLTSFVGDESIAEQLSQKLTKSNLLAQYYSDLTLFRVALTAMHEKSLPDDVTALAPQSLLELAQSIKWPPDEPNILKYKALKEYDDEQKVGYLLTRLCENNPVEFNLKSLDFISRL